MNNNGNNYIPGPCAEFQLLLVLEDEIENQIFSFSSRVCHGSEDLMRGIHIKSLKLHIKNKNK